MTTPKPKPAVRSRRCARCGKRLMIERGSPYCPDCIRRETQVSRQAAAS